MLLAGGCGDNSLNESAKIELRLLDIPYTPREIKDNENAEYIYTAIKEDFDINLSFNPEAHLKPEQINRQAREKYETLKTYNKTSLNIALNEVHTSINGALGYSAEDIKKRKLPNSRKVRKIAFLLLSLGRVFSVLSVICFLVALISLTASYLSKVTI